jgi:hypothetical protein
LVTLNLKNHNGTLITAESGVAGYYSGGWYTIGSTGSNGFISQEFLPGSYYFNMNYHNGTQQIGSMNVNYGGSWTQSVDFQTTLVTIHFQGNTGIAHSGASIGYYSGGWYTLGTTDGSGNASMEMLPVPYYYNATLTGYGTFQIGQYTDGSSTAYHVIQSSVAAKSGKNVTATTTEEKVEFSVFPNPSNGVFYIKIADKKQINILVLDMTGKVVESKDFADNVGDAIQINVEDAAQGCLYG